MAGDTSTVGGIIAGRNPLEYSSSEPITLFLFQAIFIIGLCQIVHIPLGWIRQPRVIAEVITGILLGPTVFDRIPGFTDTCFPTESKTNLTLVANLGVILFLFLVGLEVDLKFIRKNYKAALTVCAVNMSLPFGLGAAIAVGLFNQYGEPHLKFTTYMVFISVAMCITAFPVLARILTELRLLKERVGTLVLAAGIVNDVIGWMLLALSVTLANSGSGINTLYILLVVVGWGLFVWYPMRWFLVKVVLKKDLVSGNLSRFSILFILLLVFLSSFFTDIIGVHPIFGAFLVGIIVPREHGFVISITHKIEDIVHIVLIPIYFALAGFNVDLGELTEGIDWAYVIGLIVVAVVSKIVGGAIGAKVYGLFWRESFTVGILMSCKGIVEIVVLNIGLNAGIITTKVFSMFVLMTLVSTFLTTPLTLWVYPSSYREKVQRFQRKEIGWDGKNFTNEPPAPPEEADQTVDHKSTTETAIEEVVTLKRLFYNVEDPADLLCMLKFTELLYGPPPFTGEDQPMCNVILLRELTERTADLIGASSILNHDQDDEDHSYDIRLGLLRKMFEYTRIPYRGEVTYYISNDRLATYWDSANSKEDLAVYAVPATKLDLRFAATVKAQMSVSREGATALLVTRDSVEHTRFTRVCVKFDLKSDSVNSLLISLCCMALSNNSARFGDVFVVRDVGFEDVAFESLVHKLRERSKLEVVVLASIQDQRMMGGLLMAPMVADNVVDTVVSTEELNIDTLLVHKR